MSQATEAVPTFDFSAPEIWVPVYQPLIHCTARKEVLYGSRDSLKSGHVVRRIVVRMLASKCKGMLVRKAFNSIKGSQYEEIKKFVEENGLADQFLFRSAPLEIICRTTGSVAIARGMDESGKSKSIPGIDWVWFEEADELTLEDYTQTTLTMRGKNLKEWITFNSTYPEHWLLKRFFPGTADDTGKFTPDLSFETPDGLFTWVKSPDPSAVILHTCYLHNPYCNEQRRKEFEYMRTNEPNNYRTKGLGLIGIRNTGSAWLKNFRRSAHMRSVSHDPELPSHLSFDQNNLPYATCLVIQVVPIPAEKITEIRVVRELCMKPPKNTSEHACDEFIYHYGHTRPSVYIYGDPSGGNKAPRKTKNEALTHYDAIVTALRSFLAQGYNRVSRHAPSIKGRQRFMERLLAGGMELRLVIDPSCRNLIGDFEHLVEDENGGFVKKRIEDKETGQSWEERGHGADALVYFFAQAYPDLYRYISRA